MRAPAAPPMPDTVRLRFRLDRASRDIAVADLADAGLDAFEETPDGLVVYVPADAWADDTSPARAVVRDLVATGTPPPDEEPVADQNWNALWEASIDPVAVGAFVVAPTWAEAPPLDGRTLLRVDPKMAFGTGHHATTRLCLRLMEPHVPTGGRVLDVGTGTGLLAIAALARGAAWAVGVDIDPWSVENARETAALNGVSDRFEVRDGSADDVPERGFDLVLANIIRPVLQPMLPALVARAAPGAPLVLSGLLVTERERFLDALAAAGAALADEASEGDWWGCTARAAV